MMDEARKRQILQLWEDARNNIERLSVIDNLKKHEQDALMRSHGADDICRKVVDLLDINYEERYYVKITHKPRQ